MPPQVDARSPRPPPYPPRRPAPPPAASPSSPSADAAVRAKARALGGTALGLGIGAVLGLLVGFGATPVAGPFGFLLPLALGIAALATGFAAKGMVPPYVADAGRGMAIAGIVLGMSALGLALLGVLFMLLLLAICCNAANRSESTCTCDCDESDGSGTGGGPGGDGDGGGSAPPPTEGPPREDPTGGGCCCDDCDSCCDSCCGGSPEGAAHMGACGHEAGAVAAAAPLAAPLATVVTQRVPARMFAWRLPAHALAHHPHRPEYDEDVYHVAGGRLCVGCFTVYPAFVLGTLAAPWLGLAWLHLVLVGGGLATAQAVSAAGWARRRWQKAAVKMALGSGLGLAVQGVLGAPWHDVLQAAALLAMMALAYASTVPRALRLARDHAGGHA